MPTFEVTVELNRTFLLKDKYTEMMTRHNLTSEIVLTNLLVKQADIEVWE